MGRNLVNRAIHSLKLHALDTADLLRGRRDELVPPRRMAQFVGHGDFSATGEEFLGHFLTLLELQPHEHVLEIGCGIGRMARPLAHYLTLAGSYEGFDVDRAGVQWCQRHYAPSHPHMSFRHVDLANGIYNPGGAIAASQFRFPYPDGRFDVAFATSVFTHLLPGEVDRYLHETARVLRPQGRCLFTFFLLTDQTDELIKQGASDFSFRRAGPEHAVLDPQEPERAVAYEESWVRARVAEHGLGVADPVHHGSWCGPRAHLSYQDIVVGRRRSS